MECCNVSTDWRNESKQGNRWISNQLCPYWLVWCYENIGNFHWVFICDLSVSIALQRLWIKHGLAQHPQSIPLIAIRIVLDRLLISRRGLTTRRSLAMHGWPWILWGKIENSSDLLLLPSLPFCIIFYFSLYLSSSFCGNEILSQLSASLLNTLIHYKCYQSQCFPLGKEKVMTDTGNVSPSVHACVIIAYFQSVSQLCLFYLHRPIWKHHFINTRKVSPLMKQLC